MYTLDSLMSWFSSHGSSKLDRSQHMEMAFTLWSTPKKLQLDFMTYTRMRIIHPPPNPIVLVYEYVFLSLLTKQSLFPLLEASTNDL